MHHTIKLIFRACFAAVIFLVTGALVLTCFAKAQEIFQAQQNLNNAKTIELKSTPAEQLVLLSNTNKPDPAVYIAIAQNGYVAKSACAHYPQICTEAYNQQHTRMISSTELIHAGNFYYISKVSFSDSRNQQIQTLHYTPAQIEQFYASDISSLKYTLCGIALFALAALYVSIRILRNFKKFMSK